ncbi:hypothetical protein AU255_09220 [Methyloprofundus sedimenti]|uniref:Uncharacterized protein n=1 Tax=Methyloprofundus sedimenti TaxID=1420851 RepID=A0A1V8M912_9GAMM|nr:hypothetical protein [Methyloprofundus sedimenti]OQK18018.1 hypothetical protein AU255_09220 [Methyloprofundus sedimenti]
MINPEKLESALAKNAVNAKKALDAIRVEIDNIDDEIHWLENSPLCLDDAKAKIRSFIKKNTTANGIEQFFYDHELQANGVFDVRVKLDSEIRVVDSFLTGRGGIADLSQIMCSLFGQNLQRILEDMATKAAKNIQSGPMLHERPKLKTELLTKKRTLEIEEEAIICASERLGGRGFYRRHDCNPEVVLMMEKEDA